MYWVYPSCPPVLCKFLSHKPHLKFQPTLFSKRPVSALGILQILHPPPLPFYFTYSLMPCLPHLDLHPFPTLPLPPLPLVPHYHPPPLYYFFIILPPWQLFKMFHPLSLLYTLPFSLLPSSIFPYRLPKIIRTPTTL